MSTFLIKTLALITMVIDHLGFYLIKDEELYTIFRLIGRISAPLFFFAFTIGFINTSNRIKYIKRLFLFSIIMFVGNNLISILFNKYIYSNIFITLLLSALFLENIEHNKNKKTKILINLIIIILFSYVEYSYLALFCICIFYFYNKSVLSFKKLKCDICLLISYLLVTILYCIITQNYIQIFMIVSIIPILYYNGKKGYNNKFIKYFYYIFYVLHIWIFALFS